MNSKQLTVVLVRPQYPFNIGASARAMHNMGIERLVLIAPACEIDNHAREGASNAQEILARRQTYLSLEEFYKAEGEGLRIAFTRRDGLRRTVQPFTEFVKTELSPKLSDEWSHIPIYLMFGAEDDGLSTAELELANKLCSLATYGKNGSYNLAQAVLLALFVIQENTSANIQQNIAPNAPLEFPKELIDKWLETVGFNLELSDKRNISLVLNTLLLRAVPTSEEVRLLNSVLQQNIRKLKERSGNL